MFLLPLLISLTHPAATANEPAATTARRSDSNVDAALSKIADDAVARGAGDELVHVLIRVRGERPDPARLRAARDLPEDTDESRDLRQRELALATQDMEGAARTLHANLGAYIDGLGGKKGVSYWITNAISANVPARAVRNLSAHPDVLWISPDRVIRPAQDYCTSGSHPATPFTNAVWIPYSASQFQFGGEAQIRMNLAYNNGFDGAMFATGSSWLVAFRVPIAIADTGFDLVTDQWRTVSGSPCWCPSTTTTVSATCDPGSGIHGEFTTIGYLAPLSCQQTGRVTFSEDTWNAYQVSQGLTPDPWNTPEAIYWNSGANWIGYGHGTSITSLAAGSLYPDMQGEINPPCIVQCQSGYLGNFCQLMGMRGVAPGAALQLYKIAQDAQDSLATTGSALLALQHAAQNGAWIFNLSFEMNQYPNDASSVGFDQAATDYDIVVVTAAGNQGGAIWPDQVTHGGFNELVVAATGNSGIYTDSISPGSSHGPLAWPDPNDPTGMTDIISRRSGVNIAAPGGYWTNDPYTGTLNALFVGLTTPYPEESYSQVTSWGTYANGSWAWGPIAGTSASSPLVAGAAALVHEASMTSPGVRVLNARQVRAILLNEADDISAAGLNPANNESINGYGLGRLNCFRATNFFAANDATFTGSVNPAQPSRSFVLTLSAARPVEITLTWDRVAFPTTDVRCSNLDLEVYQFVTSMGPPATTHPVLIQASRDPENNFEHVSFSAPATGNYSIRVVVPAGGFILDDSGVTPDVPFALAISR